jgi:hypothetical protein
MFNIRRPFFGHRRLGESYPTWVSAHLPVPLSFIHHRATTMLTTPSRCHPPPPAAAHAWRRTTHLCSEEDAAHAHAWRRTSVTAADPPTFRGGVLTLGGGHRSLPLVHPSSEEECSPLVAAGLSSYAASRAAHHCSSVATAARSSGHCPSPWSTCSC